MRASGAHRRCQLRRSRAGAIAMRPVSRPPPFVISGARRRRQLRTVPGRCPLLHAGAAPSTVASGA
eukprot:7353866-Alexandrium_andersonii.AAC.1